MTQKAPPPDLTSGPVASTLFLFALPVLGMSVLQSMNGSVNSILVSRLLGEQALTATSNANLVLFLILGAVFGIGMSATIIMAQAVGANDWHKARRIVGTSATFFFVASAIMAILGWIWTDAILNALGTPADALPLARDYLKIIFVATPMLNLMSFVMTVLRGAGDARTPFVFMTLSVILDICFNPFFIFGLGPVPAMGIAGSAAATLASQAVTLLAITILLYARKHPLRLAGPDLALLKPDPQILWVIVVKGVPMGLQMIVISSAALSLMGLVNSYGSSVAAAYGIAAQLWTYVQMPALAIGAAVSTMAAQNVGAAHWDRIGRITAAGVCFNILLTGAMVALLLIFEHSVLGLFLSENNEAFKIAGNINSVASWSFILFGITTVLFATVRATGAVIPPLLILAFSLLAVRTTFAYSLQPMLGDQAIWWSFAVGSVSSLVLAIGYYFLGRWRSKSTTIEHHLTTGQAPETGLGVQCIPSGRTENNNHRTGAVSGLSLA
ncbi:MATE family efflux transporter [Rhizobium lentis]|uniref:MATE family efflux transporter n=1 Tax=Rhizobium lentis TaxID=1138194 RepID=A0ABS7IEJ8_9HYPH|nr:MATE family efflux transporter [Rhizobium lentis]MBX5041195.1 MATE family efflux transporter [Rhizobium lentis]MBX5051894.1 MATE family efflux transporter [Rhizobium lentis]MBX5071452.1 MATE family efflux transporter [Rhizobium lentis]MBX5088440.1 MATE family efflux transporter [Rhizobium lentis]MBX5108510.1 MATE family efflux transporter [Rhizobium lentis]